MSNLGKKKKRYSKEFKLQAVRLVKEKGLTYAQVAEDLGVPNGTMIFRWKAQFEKDGEYIPPMKGEKPNLKDARIRELEAENERLRMERDILKKATAYFAKLPD